MNNLIIIGCSALKLDYPSPAKDLYTGVIFKKSLNLANRIGGDIYILSGLHGLITPDTIIEPYEFGLEGPIFDQKYPREQQPQKSRERRARNKIKVVELREKLKQQGITDENYDIAYCGVSEYYLPALEGTVLIKPYKHLLKGGFGFFVLRGSFIDEQYDRLDMLPLGNHKSHQKWYKENKIINNG
jgi:hypothetical protein